MNNDQYDDGLSCGTCLEAVLHEPSGPRNFKAIVDNRCPECVHGDLDLGVIGDGRWDIDWSFIDCPDEDLIVTTRGSNSFYGKVKVEAGGGVNSVTINGKNAYSTSDGYWVVEDSTGSLGCGPKLEIVFENNTEEVLCVDGKLFGGDCPSNEMCKIHEKTEKPDTPETAPKPTARPTVRPTARPTPRPAPEQTEQTPKPTPKTSKPGPEITSECNGEWTQCGGLQYAETHEGSHCCQYPLECTFINEWFSYCTLPDKGDCQSRWMQCGGENWDGLTCCNIGTTCVYRNKFYSQCL